MVLAFRQRFIYIFFQVGRPDSAGILLPQMSVQELSELALGQG